MGSSTIFGENSLFSNLNTPGGAAMSAQIMIALAAIVIIIHITKLPFIALVRKLIILIGKLFAKFVSAQEKRYHRDLEIGKLDAKRRTVKLYSFMQDLIIDLDLVKTGVTPYEFMWIVITIVCIVALLICKLLFDNIFLVIFVAPIFIVAAFSGLYTKANVRHDMRIENVIEAENIICNNIRAGVLVAVRDSLDTLPRSIRIYFKDFIDDVEQRNYHIRVALQNLNMKLGSVADDFIKKCIVFEMEEEHGIAGMFADVVEMNNIHMEMRINAKRRFEEVKQQFIIGACMIYVFLAGVLAIYGDVRQWYFTTMIGQVIILLDMLLFVMEFMYITYLRAKEL